MNRSLRVSCVLLTLVLGCATTSTSQGADLILFGGRVVTLDPKQPEGRAIAIRNGRVLVVGSDREVERHAGAKTRRIDLNGALAIPGFIEGHGHFLGIGDMGLQLDLTRSTSHADIVTRVALAVNGTSAGELIRGRGWHQSKWTDSPQPSVQGLPTHAKLSAASPDNPVILRHASGHAAMANQLAMQLAGIDRNTPDPDGGEIVRDATGNPIGVFRESAMALLGPVYARAAEPAPRRLAALARDECLAKGITSFQDAGSSLEVVALYRDMAMHGELGLRMYVMLSDSNERLATLSASSPQKLSTPERVKVGGIKRSIDGALGSHGAWLLEPYSDHPESRGLNTLSIEDLRETAQIASDLGLQLCVHAIGDRANREVLDIFEATLEANPELEDPRWRIEHAQHLNPADIPRFAKLGVIASMQAVHCTSDASFVITRLGETRAREGAYLWRTLSDHGVIVTNGTDAPVEDVDPIANYHSAVTRMTSSGEPFFENQRLTRLEALRSYTLNNAYATFEENDKGSLAPGKFADITVLSKDILIIPAKEIPTTQVLYTIIDGRVLYQQAP